MIDPKDDGVNTGHWETKAHNPETPMLSKW